MVREYILNSVLEILGTNRQTDAYFINMERFIKKYSKVNVCITLFGFVIIKK